MDTCIDKLKKLDKSTSSKIVQVKDLIVSMAADRSDDRVITDGVIELRQLIIDRQRFVGTVDMLKYDAQAALTRLVNKFGTSDYRLFKASPIMRLLSSCGVLRYPKE